MNTPIERAPLSSILRNTRQASSLLLQARQVTSSFTRAQTITLLGA